MSNPPATLTASKLVLPLGIFFSIFVPLAFWLGWHQTEPWGHFEVPWMASPFPWIAGGIVALLLVGPLVWIGVSGVADFLALTLGMEALMMAGYFFLDRSSAGLETLSFAVQRMAGLVLLFNTIGFLALLISTAFVYSLCAASRARLPVLLGPAGELDQRILWLLRLSAMFAIAVVALPMALTRTIPLLSGDPSEARYAMMSSDIGRALYLAGSSFVPFIIAGLGIVIWRSPRRILGPDGVMLLLLAFLQLLTGNRSPLMFSLVTFIALWTLEKRRSRWVAAGAIVAYLFSVTFLSGVTGLARTGKLAQSNVVQASLEEAFLGNNLIDFHDGSWVMACWDFKPLEGRTYLGGLFSMVPSAVFPQKKQWHMGLTAIRIVGYPETHFGLRVTFFAEAFMNFGFAGVVGLGVLMGALYGLLLRAWHLAAREPPSLWRNLLLAVLFQLTMLLHNSSEAYSLWTLLVFLATMILLGRWGWRRAPSRPFVLRSLAATPSA